MSASVTIQAFRRYVYVQDNVYPVFGSTVPVHFYGPLILFFFVSPKFMCLADYIIIQKSVPQNGNIWMAISDPLVKVKSRKATVGENKFAKA